MGWEMRDRGVLGEVTDNGRKCRDPLPPAPR